MAAATSRLRLIASVIALPRRRPQLIAQSAATLDRLSNGRLTLGLGSGGDPGDFEPFGESYERAPRVALLDEGLPLIDAWLRGQKVDHAGSGYTACGATIGPACVQQPRPPIWLGGMRPGGLRRAARWDGWICIGVSDDGSTMTMTPELLAEMVNRIRATRRELGKAGEPFDVAVFGYSEPDQPGYVPSFGAAGATWWLESLSLMRGDLAALQARVNLGAAASAITGWSRVGLVQDPNHQRSERRGLVEVGAVPGASEDDLFLARRDEYVEPLVRRHRPAARLVLAEHQVDGHFQTRRGAPEVDLLQLRIQHIETVEEAAEGVQEIQQ